MNEIVLEARDVSRALMGEQPVSLVEHVDLAVERGEFLAVTGPSGSGKSSLLYLLGLLDTPTCGEILLDGVPTSGWDSDVKAGSRLAHIGFVFQFHFLLPEFTVLQNIQVPMRRLGGRNSDAMREDAKCLLDRLNLGGFGGKYPEQLSGGERQRVAIARALANRPLVILADEPTGNLDSSNSQRVFDIFGELTGQGISIVVVTHDEPLARQTDRRVRLVDGRIANPSGR